MTSWSVFNSFGVENMKHPWNSTDSLNLPTDEVWRVSIYFCCLYLLASIWSEHNWENDINMMSWFGIEWSDTDNSNKTVK